jgi:hypothetical protein
MLFGRETRDPKAEPRSEKMAEGKDEMPDPEQLRQIFQVIGESVPELLDKITKILYSAAEGERFGQSVAAFYKALVAAGMSKDQAFTLTKEYMNNVSLGGMLKNIFSGGLSRDLSEDMGGKH